MRNAFDDAGAEEWQPFLQVVADKWTSYEDTAGNPRPHWAKQWAGLTVKGQPVEKYFKEVAYKSSFEEFRHAFEGIVTKRRGSVQGSLDRFGTSTMQRLIFQ